MPDSEWTKRKLVPKGDLEAWHALDLAEDGSNVDDFSGKDRTLSCPSNEPTLQTDVINGRPALYFDGADNFLRYTGAFTARHVFVLGAYEDAAFGANEAGLLTDNATTGILVGNSVSTRFFNFNFGASGEFDYKRADVAFAEADQQAPVNSVFKLMEVSLDSGWAMDGIRVGQDRTFSSRLWKGWYVESLIYSEVKSDAERWEIYRYFAMKYHLWQETSSGLYVFPFQANRTRPTSRGQEHYLSEPYSGDAKVLVRGGKRKEFQLPFQLRSDVEAVAAQKFHEDHYPDPTDHFIVRDFNYWPPEDHECRFTSPFEEQGSDVAFRFNYSFSALEI